MSRRQVQKMLRLMASGEAVELTSPMASVKKLATLALAGAHLSSRPPAG